MLFAELQKGLQLAIESLSVCPVRFICTYRTGSVGGGGGGRFPLKQQITHNITAPTFFRNLCCY